MGVGGAASFGWKITNRTVSEKKKKEGTCEEIVEHRIAIERKRPSAMSLLKPSRSTCENQCKMKGPTPKKTWRCGFQACDFTAKTHYRLRQHKEQEGHKKQVGRPH